MQIFMMCKMCFDVYFSFDIQIWVRRCDCFTNAKSFIELIYQLLLQPADVFYTLDLLCRIHINLYESLQIFKSYILVRLFVRFSSTYVDVMFPRILSFAKSQRLRICTRSNSISPSGQEEATLIIAVISQTGIYGQWISYQDDLRK